MRTRAHKLTDSQDTRKGHNFMQRHENFLKSINNTYFEEFNVSPTLQDGGCQNCRIQSRIHKFTDSHDIRKGDFVLRNDNLL